MGNRKPIRSSTTPLIRGPLLSDSAAVTPCAVFAGMQVTVDGVPCPSERFIRGRPSLYPQLGCRIKVVRETELSGSHRTAPMARNYGDNVLLNFHGQVVAFNHRPIANHDLHYLVDMTGQPTGIRLMLPARTCLVQNEAFDQLKAALELEAYKYLQQQGRHRLPYQQYLRARELGIELPEAEPVFKVGLLFNDMMPEPIEVEMPKGQKLAQCYRLSEAVAGDDADFANVHLLAALGQFEQPFVPVEIHKEYDGYSWSKLPTVDRVEVKARKTLLESWIEGGNLICVEDLSITAHCSDGKVYHSAVCMAEKPWDREAEDGQKSWYGDCEVYVTPDAQICLSDSQIWYHFGGYSDEGDSYETQEYDFEKQMDDFWQQLLGPDEPLRAKLLDCLHELEEGWQSVTILPQGQVTIRLKDGKEKTVLPPQKSGSHV